MVEQDSFFVLVNAYPASVQAREVYSYSVEITANSNTSSTDSPQGHVQVRLPYDGFQHFTLEEAERLKQQIVNRSDPTIQGRIGWLAVSPPLDWEHDWSRPTGAEVIPVQVPLRGEKFSETQWTSDQMCSVVRHTYSPASLHFWPVNIAMQVYDDISVPEGTLQDYLSLLKSGKVQEGQLIIDLTITALIPAVLARDDIHVWLETLELAWPVIAPAWQLDVQQLPPRGRENQAPDQVTWRYNPDRRVVQVCKVQARRDEPDEGSPLVPFKCDMRFFLRVPGQIVSQDELKGSVRLRLDGILLSGREVSWLQVTGHRITGQNQLVHQQTYLEVGLSAWLSDQFKHRRATTYRRWCFSGVRLSADRLGDVAAALRDLGYQIVKSPVLAEDGATGTLAASRPAVTPDGDPTLLQLEVLAERMSAAQTRREREMEGVRITTEIETSDVVIHVRGQMRGPISMIALDLERLMTALKGQFAAVADLR